MIAITVPSLVCSKNAPIGAFHKLWQHPNLSGAQIISNFLTALAVLSGIRTVAPTATSFCNWIQTSARLQKITGCKTVVM
jgi:hypothetical protein